MMQSSADCYYRVFGCTLHTNRPLKELQSVSIAEVAHPDITITFVGDDRLHLNGIQQIPVYPLDRSAPRVSLYQVTRLDDGRLRLFLDGMLIQAREYFEFVIQPDGSHIRAAWASETPFDDIVPHLLNAGLGVALRLRGVLCLHGNALAYGDRAFVLIGTKGAGKSTTTNTLIDAGCVLLSDDVTPINWHADAAYVESGYPRLRLRPDTVTAFYGSSGALPAVWTERPYPLNKRYRVLSEQEFKAQSYPLTAVYLLGERRAGFTEPLLTPLAGAARMMGYAANTSAAYALDTAGRRVEMEQLQRLAGQIPLIQVTLPDGLNTLPAAAASLLKDVSQR